MAGLVSDAVELVVDCLGSNLWMDYFGILQLTVQVIFMNFCGDSLPHV